MGGEGIDTISAGDGTDTITGGEGDDIITGGEGDDIITGEAGNDITGGAWFDTFNVDVGSDTIKRLIQASDILVVSSGATANATISASYTATNLTKK